MGEFYGGIWSNQRRQSLWTPSAERRSDSTRVRQWHPGNCCTISGTYVSAASHRGIFSARPDNPHRCGMTIDFQEAAKAGRALETGNGFRTGGGRRHHNDGSVATDRAVVRPIPGQTVSFPTVLKGIRSGPQPMLCVKLGGHEHGSGLFNSPLQDCAGLYQVRPVSAATRNLPPSEYLLAGTW